MVEGCERGRLTSATLLLVEYDNADVYDTRHAEASRAVSKSMVFGSVSNVLLRPNSRYSQCTSSSHQDDKRRASF